MITTCHAAGVKVIAGIPRPFYHSDSIANEKPVDTIFNHMTGMGSIGVAGDTYTHYVRWHNFTFPWASTSDTFQ